MAQSVPADLFVGDTAPFRFYIAPQEDRRRIVDIITVIPVKIFGPHLFE